MVDVLAGVSRGSSSRVGKALRACGVAVSGCDVVAGLGSVPRTKALSFFAMEPRKVSSFSCGLFFEGRILRIGDGTAIKVKFRVRRCCAVINANGIALKAR